MKYDVTKGGYILLGRCGENLARTVEIDVSEYLKEYPGAVVTLLHRRHGESGIYPVAARERMGVDGGYELIEEITIAEENVSVIARDVNRLRSAKMVIICPPMESIITANALIFFGDASKPQYIYLFSEIAPSKVGRYRHITLETELRNNYWRVYKTTESETGDMYPNGSWTTSIGETAPSRLMQLPSRNLDAITKITLNAYPTGAYIPVGTKIMIYGVRA